MHLLELLLENLGSNYKYTICKEKSLMKGAIFATICKGKFNLSNIEATILKSKRSSQDKCSLKYILWF